MAFPVSVDTTLPKTLPLLFRQRAERIPDTCSQASKNKDGKYEYFSYKTVYSEILAFAAILQKLGCHKESHVGIISDNRREWLITDMAVLTLRGADVPRGCDSMGSEIRYILNAADCEISFFENERQLLKVLENLSEVPNLKTVILYDEPKEETRAKAKDAGLDLYTFWALLDEGKQMVAQDPSILTAIEADMDAAEDSEIATLIFTSGTTGVPKGVMLSHRNFTAQLEIIHVCLPSHVGDMWLSILPVWHSFERCIQYIAICLNTGLAYSKPVGSVMLADMAVIKPQFMCGVPRVWEALATGVKRAMKKTGGAPYALFRFFTWWGGMYVWAKEHLTGRVCQFSKRSRFLDALIAIIPFILLWPLAQLGDAIIFKKIRAKFGGQMICTISGGGALQKETDLFYRIARINILEGYGMTETAPVLSVRDWRKARPGSVGPILPCAEVRVVAEKDGVAVNMDPLPPGQQGLIYVKGDQVMKGYYKQPELTKTILSDDGWLNTGDLGMFSYDGEIKITGRAKDTIVLLGGENIEPLALESALNGSQYIETAVVLGQDKKYLAALLVADKTMVEGYAKDNNLTYDNYESLLKTPEIQQLFTSEVENIINAKNGFKTCERIFKFTLLPKSFSVGEELSAKQEIIRPKINKIYQAEIDNLFAD